MTALTEMGLSWGLCAFKVNAKLIIFPQKMAMRDNQIVIQSFLILSIVQYRISENHVC